MKRAIAISIVLLGAFSVLSASTKPPKFKSYLQGTVLRVEKQNIRPNSVGQNPADAPLPDPETYDYDVAVRVNCGTYVGRYESWYDYLPSVFSPSQKIHLRLTRSAMYVDVPNQKELELNIISRRIERGACNSVKN